MTRLLLTLALAAIARENYAGSLDRPGSGLQPSQGGLAAPVGESYRLAGLVIQKLPNGLLVDTPQIRSSSKPRGVVFVEGSFPMVFSGDRVSIMVRDAGTMTYTAAGGSIEVVRKFVISK